VAMIGARRPRLPIVLERHERAGRSAIHAGEPSLAHRRDDTRRNRHTGSEPRRRLHIRTRATNAPMRCYAGGDSIDMRATLRDLPVPLTSVEDYAAAAAGLAAVPA
jgi:hypothetical protein